VFAIIIVAYHTEIFFASQSSAPQAGDDLPTEVCQHYDQDGEDYYGYRVCSNSVAGGIINILLCITLLIIDLLIPCLPSGVSS